jgi:phosphoglycolate phosphatase
MILSAGNKEIDCRLVIFDKDGTLVDLYSLVLANAKLRRDRIQKLGGLEIAKLWGKIVGVNLETGRIDTDGPLVSRPEKDEIEVASLSFYINGYGWNESRRLTEAAYEEAEQISRPLFGSVLMKGVREKLETLKRNGLKLAIASNGKHAHIEESFTALGIRPLFDVIVGCDDVNVVKPSPDMINEVLKMTGVRASEAVIVGDSCDDMKMGRNAGVKACIGVLTGGGTREKLGVLADIVIESIAELKVDCVPIYGNSEGQ